MDLLDRVLERGLIVQADIIVTLAGVPLIGINLRAAVAGMETMTKYGLMTDWDTSIRAREQETSSLARTLPQLSAAAPEQSAERVAE